jgi:hypothetical protein
MNILKHIGQIALGLATLYIAYITGTGDILNYINFSDPLGEFAFCIFSLLLGIFFLYSGFSKTKLTK